MKKIIFTSIVLCCLFSACSGSMVNKDFENFAGEFIANGITGYEGFGMYCESRIETTVFIDNQDKKAIEDPSVSFPYLKNCFFSYQNYTVNQISKEIKFKGAAFKKSTAILSFRRDDFGKWKLYRYECY